MRHHIEKHQVDRTWVWSSSSAIRLAPSQIRACGFPALGPRDILSFVANNPQPAPSLSTLQTGRYHPACKTSVSASRPTMV